MTEFVPEVVVATLLKDTAEYPSSNGKSKVLPSSAKRRAASLINFAVVFIVACFALALAAVSVVLFVEQNTVFALLFLALFVVVSLVLVLTLIFKSKRLKKVTYTVTGKGVVKEVAKNTMTVEVENGDIIKCHFTINGGDRRYNVGDEVRVNYTKNNINIEIPCVVQLNLRDLAF